jgi:hypothetical protein
MADLRAVEAPPAAALMALTMDDADPVSLCLVVPAGSHQCAWHAHGDSLSDAVLAWARHLAHDHRGDWD